MWRRVSWKIWVSGIIVCLVVASALFLSRGDKEISVPHRKEAADVLVAAEVNGEPILASEFQERCAEMARRLGPSGAQRTEVLSALKRSILEEMIERRLLLQEAAKRAVTVSDEELEAAVAELWEEGAQDEARAAGEARVDRGAWAEKLREMLIVDKLMQSAPGGVAEVTEKEVAEYYDTYSENYARPSRVRVLQIMVNDRDKARLIRQQLVEGADFAELARAESLSPDSEQGGEMGLFAKRDLPASIERVVFRLKVNSVSKIVKSDHGYHIFKVAEILPAKRLELDEARDQIAEALLSQRQQQLFQDWVESLRDAAAVTIHEDVLAAAQLTLGASPVSSGNDEQAPGQ